MTKTHPANQTHDEVIQQLLERRPDFVEAYLEVSAEGATDEVGRTIFLRALHRVAKFRGLTEVAEKAGMTPESLSRALSGQADPSFKVFVDITQAVGMRLALVPVKAPKPAPKKRKPAAKKPKSPRKATA